MDQNPETLRLWPRDHDNGVQLPQNRWNPFNSWIRIDLSYLISLYFFTFFAGLFILTLGLCIASFAVPIWQFLWYLLWLFRGWIVIHIMIGTSTALIIGGALTLAQWRGCFRVGDEAVNYLRWRFVVFTRGTRKALVVKKADWLIIRVSKEI